LAQAILAQAILAQGFGSSLAFVLSRLLFRFGCNSCVGRNFLCARISSLFGANQHCRSALRCRRLSPHTAEPAWHRRLRRKRQLARGVLAVQAARHLLAGHHGGGMAPPKREQWEPVRHGAKAKVACLKAGCGGHCPLAVVIRSNKSDGFPAKCQVCDRVFAVPANTKDAPRGAANKDAPRGAAKSKSTSVGKDKGPEKPSGDVKNLLAVVSQLQAEVASLKSQKVQAAAPPPAPDATVGVSAMSPGDKQEAASLQKQIQQVNDMDPALRDVLCEAKGGFVSFVAQLQHQRQQIFAKHRGSQPVDVQKAKCEAYHRAMQRLKEEADEQLSALLVQQLELQSSIEKQTVAVANADAKLHGACAELASITQQAELLAPTVLTGAVAGSGGGDHSAVTAASVKGFFQSLPGEVVSHPEGQQTILQVMALLEKLDAAAKSTQAIPSVAVAVDPNLGMPPRPVDDAEMSTDDLFDEFDSVVGIGTDTEGRPARVAGLKAKFEARLNTKNERGVASKFGKAGK
jgi:hypothetical protein